MATSVGQKYFFVPNDRNQEDILFVSPFFSLFICFFFLSSSVFYFLSLSLCCSFYFRNSLLWFLNDFQKVILTFKLTTWTYFVPFVAFYLVTRKKLLIKATITKNKFWQCTSLLRWGGGDNFFFEDLKK